MSVAGALLGGKGKANLPSYTSDRLSLMFDKRLNSEWPHKVACVRNQEAFFFFWWEMFWNTIARFLSLQKSLWKERGLWSWSDQLLEAFRDKVTKAGLVPTKTKWALHQQICATNYKVCDWPEVSYNMKSTWRFSELWGEQGGRHRFPPAFQVSLGLQAQVLPV